MKQLRTDIAKEKAKCLRVAENGVKMSHVYAMAIPIIAITSMYLLIPVVLVVAYVNYRGMTLMRGAWDKWCELEDRVFASGVDDLASLRAEYKAIKNTYL